MADCMQQFYNLPTTCFKSMALVHVQAHAADAMHFDLRKLVATLGFQSCERHGLSLRTNGVPKYGAAASHLSLLDARRVLPGHFRRRTFAAAIFGH